MAALVSAFMCCGIIAFKLYGFLFCCGAKFTCSLILTQYSGFVVGQSWTLINISLRNRVQFAKKSIHFSPICLKNIVINRAFTTNTVFVLIIV